MSESNGAAKVTIGSGALGASGGIGGVILLLQLFGSQLGIPSQKEIDAHADQIKNLKGDIEQLEWKIAWMQYGETNAGPPPPPDVINVPR